jgi:hypothetical protein
MELQLAGRWVAVRVAHLALQRADQMGRTKAVTTAEKTAVNLVDKLATLKVVH